MCFKFASIIPKDVLSYKNKVVCALSDFYSRSLQYSTTPYLFSLLLLFVGSEERSMSPSVTARAERHWAQLPTVNVKRQRSLRINAAARGIALHCEIDELFAWHHLAHTFQPNTPACPRTHILRYRNTTEQLLRRFTGRLRTVRSCCKNRPVGTSTPPDVTI